MWWPTGTTPSHTLTGLASGTYYWQVRADAGSGPIEGDGGTWWAFTVAPPPTAVTVVPWGTSQTWIRWENEADDMSDFHVERSTDGGAWSEIVQQGARSYLDASPTCGPVAYRVRTHRHDSNQYSDFTNVASITRSCFGATTGLSVAGANSGPVGGPPIGGTPAAAWLALVTLAGLTLTGWRRRFRPVRRVATLAVVAWLALLWPAAAAAQSAIEYYHTDALGSVRAVTKQVNGQWQVVARYDYMPFGEDVPAAQPDKPYKRLFTGKSRDQETGLDYFEARYLRASVGRFTTADRPWADQRLADPQSWGLYVYVRNNPLKYTDPTGRWGQDVHQRLTFLLALAAGYRTSTAEAIAVADWNVDVEFDAWDSEENRKNWHFTTDARVADVRSVFLGRPDSSRLGEYLHVEQDRYGHLGYGSSGGHWWTNSPDETTNNPAGPFRADATVVRTYKLLVDAKGAMKESGRVVLLQGELLEFILKWTRATNKEKPDLEGKIRAYIENQLSKQ